MTSSPSPRTWTIAEAKARLSEILRRAEEEGPQCIGVRRRFVVVPAAAWREKVEEREPFGSWLVRNAPRGIELELPDRRDPERPIPFASERGK